MPYFKRIQIFYIALSAIMFLSGLNSYAQFDESKLIDKLDSVSGNDKIMVLNRLSDGVLFKSPQESFKYGKEALNLARKDSNLEMLGESYLSVAYALRYMSEYERALDSLYEAIEFINQLDNKKLQSQILNLTGLLHQDLGHDTLSLDNYIKSLSLAKETKDNYSLISVLNNLGNFYLYAGNYKKSSEYYFKCLRVYEQLKNDKGMAQSYNNIGTVFQHQGNYKKALEYHLKAYQIIKKYPNYKVGFAYIYNNLGSCYINTKDYDKAADYLLKSVEICKKLSLQEYLLANYNNLGIIYREKKEYRKAIEYLLEGLKLSDKSENKVSTSKFLLNIADVYLDEKDYNRALSYLNRALIYNKELKDYYLLSENNYGIYEALKAKGNYHNSLKYLEDYLVCRDSLDIIKNNKLVSEIEAQYELDKKEQRISTLRKDSRIKELEIEREKNHNHFLLLGLAAILIIAFLISFFLIQRIKTGRILEEQNRQINEQNEELNFINEKLIQSEIELIKSNQTKDKFFSIIAHDIKNPLLALKNLIFHIKQKKDKLLKKDFLNYTNSLESTVNSIINLLNNLLHWARAQKNEIIVFNEEIKINYLINNSIESLNKLAEEKNIQIISSLCQDSEIIYTDKNMLEFVVRNILSNSIKYSYPKTTISISCNINEQLTIIIEDHGIGISKENIKKLFDENEHLSTPGTNNETGTGLGLLLCNEFIKKLNGKIEFESSENNGSLFKIILPVLPR